MENPPDDRLYRIYPETLYAVDRNGTPGWRLNGYSKWHNLMLLYDGTAEFIGRGETVRAHAGDLIYYRPGEWRLASTTPADPIQCYALDFQYICPLYAGGHWITAAPPLPFRFRQTLSDSYLFHRLTYLFAKLTRSKLSSGDRYGNRERALVTEILVMLFRYCGDGVHSFSNQARVETAVAYMSEHFAEDITLRSLARHAGVSESYLGRIFKSVTGKAPVDYLIDIRINKAKDLLQDGASVSETARTAGFHDVYYFSRAFKKREGLSPTAFRAEL